MSNLRLTTQSLRLRFTQTQAAGVLLFLYLCHPFFVSALRAVMGPFRLASLARPAASILIYGALLLFCAAGRRFKAGDFLALLTAVVLFFLLTYLFHPEYEYWYKREPYGVWSYVLRPDNGLYIYLFLRLVDDPKEILRAIKLSALPMYLYFGVKLVAALQRGYWLQQDSIGETVQMAYNLTFGYDVLLYALVFLYLALEHRKMIDWCGAIAGVVMIFLGGSRGPILDIGIFAVLYILIKLERSRKKGLVVVLAGVVTGLAASFYSTLLHLLAAFLGMLHISNRFVTMLIQGDIADNNGRTVIWKAAIDMIKANPFGYGAMGSRHVIGNIHNVGHPHQIFLEILVDFGVIFGSLIIIFLLYHAVKLLTAKDNDAWRGVFLIFFARACQLLVSLTYWHSIGLWGALAVGVCMYRSKRTGKVKYGKQ